MARNKKPVTFVEEKVTYAVIGKTRKKVDSDRKVLKSKPKGLPPISDIRTFFKKKKSK